MPIDQAECEGFSTGPPLSSGFLHGSEVAPTESCLKESINFVDDNIDILAALLGDGDVADSNWGNDHNAFADIFESWITEEGEQIDSGIAKPSVLGMSPPKVQVQIQDEVVCLTRCKSPVKETEILMPTSVAKNLTAVKSLSGCAGISKQSLYRQNAISKWLVKRERRVFVKRVSQSNATSRSKKVVPNRSGSNGRFVKSTRGFISITEAQKPNECDNDNYYEMMGNN